MPQIGNKKYAYTKTGYARYLRDLKKIKYCRICKTKYMGSHNH